MTVEIDPLIELRERVTKVTAPLLEIYRRQMRDYRSDKIVRDVVWGMINILPHELAFIDSPFFQRLRNIFQTSLALLTYPCSVHSRFEHSLGALAIADRVIRALGRRVEITETERLEVRLAALLHDCTHGPLSHTSEVFYQSAPIFGNIKDAYPDLLGQAGAAEILTYCLLTCEGFSRLWQEIVKKYEQVIPDLNGCDPWRIATMVVGADFNPERPAAKPRPFLRQLINGPFDVDKLDYVARDGYFTGLNVAIDIERLLWVMDVIDVEENGEIKKVLCVSASGATVLEQVLFSKMQLFSSVYHHHKVRVAHQAALHLLQSLKECDVLINGLSLEDPASFLCLDDYDILHGCYQTDKNPEPQGIKTARSLAKAIKERALPKRALVLTHPVWGEDPKDASEEARISWNDQMKSSDQPSRFVAEVAKIAGVDPQGIWVDIPNPVNLQGTGQEGLVKFDDQTHLPIQKMFPIGGWLSAYQAYRLTSYIFAWERPGDVARAAKSVLDNYGIKINEVAFKLARV